MQQAAKSAVDENPPMVAFSHVSQVFDGQTVINDLNLTIPQGEIFVLVGTSGSGKTTTLKMINQLQPQASGQITIQGQNIATIGLQQLRWNIGYVLQQIALFPTMTVAENIAVIPEMKGVARSEIDALIDRLLTSVGLDPTTYRTRMPQELSGGEQQRIGICRAIASDPPLVLMDEAFSALDPISRTQLQDLVLDLHEARHDTIIFVTHDMDEALKMGDHIAVMREGKILQVATPTEIAQHPANDFVQQFFAQSVAKQDRDVYISKLVMMGFAQQQLADPQATTVTVTAGATLGEVYHQLDGVTALRVVDGKRQLGFVTAADIVRYLGQRQEP